MSLLWSLCSTPAICVSKFFKPKSSQQCGTCCCFPEYNTSYVSNKRITKLQTIFKKIYIFEIFYGDCEGLHPIPEPGVIVHIFPHFSIYAHESIWPEVIREAGKKVPFLMAVSLGPLPLPPHREFNGNQNFLRLKKTGNGF